MKKSFWAGKNGPLLIAEIGGNHEEILNAQKLVKLAITTGVDVIKLQLYSGDQLVSKFQSQKRYKHFKI